MATLDDLNKINPNYNLSPAQQNPNLPRNGQTTITKNKNGGVDIKTRSKSGGTVTVHSVNDVSPQGLAIAAKKYGLLEGDISYINNIVSGNTSSNTNTSSNNSNTSSTTNTNTSQNTGFALSGANLKFGASGDNVKQLQQYLKALGIYQGKVDGVFGPQTQSAVQQFQSANGLTSDGIVGSKTASAINSIQSGAKPGTETLAKAPDDPSNKFNTSTGEPNPKYNASATSATYNTGNPENDALLKELDDFVKNQLAQGLVVNPNLTLDQKTLDKFLETAKTQVHPFFKQQIDTIKQDVLRTAPQILQNYTNDIAGAESSFQNTLGNARENYADAGLAFSGQRAKGELGLQGEQDRNLQALNTDYGNKIYELGRTAEENIGSPNVNYTLPSLSQYSSSLGGNGGFNTTGTVSPYQKGGFALGKIPQAEASAIEERNQALKNTAAENIRIGRNYTDLFG